MKRGKPPATWWTCFDLYFRPTEHHVRLENARPIAVSALAQNSEFQSKDPIHESTTLRSLVQGQKKVPFHKKINLWAILDQTAVGMDLQMSAGLKLLRLPDRLLKDESEVESLAGLAKKLLHTLPENTTLQFVHRPAVAIPTLIVAISPRRKGFSRRSPNGDSTSQARILGRSFVQKRDLFLFITTYPTAVRTGHARRCCHERTIINN